MKTLFSVLLISLCISFGYSQDDYPEPEKTPTRLFYIQHSWNHNTYVYDAKLKGDKIDQKKPIDQYRIVYTENGIKKPLSAIQKDLAYGLKLVEAQTNLLKLRLAASKKMYFYLDKDETEGTRVHVTVNNRKIYLNRMFIKLKDNTSPLKAKAEYVLFYGNDFISNESVIEKVILE